MLAPRQRRHLPERQPQGTGEMTTLPDELQKEIDRCSELVSVYRLLPGGIGNIAASMISADIDNARQAMATQDAAEMCRMLAILRGNE